jgi:hypothetical protein
MPQGQVLVEGGEFLIFWVNAKLKAAFTVAADPTNDEAEVPSVIRHIRQVWLLRGISVV